MTIAFSNSHHSGKISYKFTWLRKYILDHDVNIKQRSILSLMLSPPRHLLATVHQDVEVDVAGGVNVVLGRLAILEIN